MNNAYAAWRYARPSGCSADTLIDAGAERVREALASSLKGAARPPTSPGAAAQSLVEIRRAAAGVSTVVVGGGDGSVSLAAHALAGTGKTLGVLPFGTLNLLARDLSMPAQIDAAIEAFGAARPRKVDLARVNGRFFHSLSGLGFFSQMARAREEVRGHPLGRLVDVGVAAFRALRRTSRFHARYPHRNSARAGRGAGGVGDE